MTHLADRQRTGLYRSRDGAILGVCKGLAAYFDFPVFWMRVIALVLLVLSGILPLAIVYFMAALLMKPEPVLPLETAGEQEFYHAYASSASSRNIALQRLKRLYDNLDHRIRRIEDIVTAPEFDWERRLSE
jgi:phage shock protein C